MVAIDVVVTFVLIIFNDILKWLYDISVYSEWFLSILIGSQLVILPFSLLLIVTKHLFPKKDKQK